MTTDHELLAKIDKYCYSSSHTSMLTGVVTESRTVNYKPSLCVSCKSLRAVVELEEKPEYGDVSGSEWDNSFNQASHAYNQALADMKQAIKKELG